MEQTDTLGPEARISAAGGVGLGLQLLALVVPGTVLFAVVVFKGAGQPESVLLWAVFVSVVVSGAVTLLQSLRLWRFGSGYLTPAGTASAAIAIAIVSLKAGGPALLATLVVSVAIFQFAVSTHLALFRHILTPTVNGTIIMLVPVTVMPVIFEQLGNVPVGTSAVAGPACALATLGVVVGIMLKARGLMRQWAPIIGVAVGSAIGAAFGLYEMDRVADAQWIGIPQAEWPGIDLKFGNEFWTLLPGFMFIAAVCTTQTISGSVAIQRVSWNTPRAIDFRAVQGSVASDAAGNLVSGLAGAIPVGFRPAGIAMAEITGVASRWLGVVLGVMLVAFACLPKALAALLAMPGPVIATFIMISMATLFMVGVKIVVQDGIDYRKGAIVGIAFWIGVGFENGVVFPEYIARLFGSVPLNGLTAGGMFAIIATLFSELTKGRRSRLDVAFDHSALVAVREFVALFASRSGWGEPMANRLDAVSEEVVLTLLGEQEPTSAVPSKRLRVSARREDSGATVEFITSPSESNLQDRIAFLGDTGVASDVLEREVSLRLLRHFASSVRHQQYHETDIVTVRVEQVMNKSENDNPSG